MTYLLAPLFLLSSLNFYSQSLQDSLHYKVIYQLNFQPDSTDVTSRKTETMWLLLGNQTSEFQSRGRSLKDSLSNPINKNIVGSTTWKAKMAETKTEFDYKIYKNRSENNFYYGLKILEDKLFYTEPLPVMNWEIKPETKEISGYQAQKAITQFAGRSYIAWFTSELPIPDGPYKFSGLPGLILEIRDTSNEYAFTFKGFEELSKKASLSLPPEAHQKSSKKNLLDLKDRYEKDPIKYINSYVGANGKQVTVKINNQSKKEYLSKRKAKLARNNNPIELD